VVPSSVGQSVISRGRLRFGIPLNKETF
jgi:hypothetical protein